MTPKTEITCLDCSNVFLAYSIKQKRCDKCQTTFRNTHRGGYKYTRVCENCNCSFKSKNGRAKKCKDCYTNGNCVICSALFKRKSSTKKYCSKKCSNIGRLDYYYEGNYSKTLIRDDWKCKKCNSKDDLQVHHIDHSGAENIRAFNSNNNIDNLITLCIPCHSQVHTITDQYFVNKYKDEVIQIFNNFLSDKL